ncbi:hypothetical protein B0H14DRAFT_3436511 [Mycena olivaceomarginata]|nr:hypothetical protein B0H14DRAFT_3436511 [Mycena olivaceomarginata]
MRQKHCSGKIPLPQFRAQHGKVDNSQYKEEAACTVNACWTCHRMTDDRKTLMRCGAGSAKRPTRKITRSIAANGNFDLKVFVPDVEELKSFIGCPAVAPGFRRSPALWRQISWLSEPDSQTRDYHIMRNIEDTGQSTSFRIFCPRARLIFLIASRRAMASGSLSSIYKMVEILGWQLEYSTITMEQVRREFELEYKAKVDTRQVAIERAVKDFADPTV